MVRLVIMSGGQVGLNLCEGWNSNLVENMGFTSFAEDVIQILIR